MKVIKSLLELQEFVDSKGAFHDWFVRRLEFNSHDSFDSSSPPGRILSERLDVALILSTCSSTESGGRLSNATITLKGARGITALLPQRDGVVFSDWGVNEVEVSEDKPGLLRFRIHSSIHKGGAWSPITLIDVPFETAEVG